MLRRTAVIPVALLVLTAAFPSLAFAQGTKAGVVTTLEGAVTVTRAASTQPVPLKFKDDVFLEDKITAGNRSIARLLLGGKAIVTVRELSTLTIRQVPGQATIELESGKIALAVARDQMRQGETITIRTANAVGAVRGTVVIAEVVRQSAQVTPAVPAVVTNFYVLRGTFLAAPFNPVTRVVGTPVPVNVLQGYSAAGAAAPRVAPITQAQLAGITSGLKPMAPQYKEGGASKEAVKAQSMQTATALLTAMFGPATGTATPAGPAGPQTTASEGTGAPTAPPTAIGPQAALTTAAAVAAMFGAFTGGTGAEALAAIFGPPPGAEGAIAPGTVPGTTGPVPGTTGLPTFGPPAGTTGIFTPPPTVGGSTLPTVPGLTTGGFVPGTGPPTTFGTTPTTAFAPSPVAFLGGVPTFTFAPTAFTTVPGTTSFFTPTTASLFSPLLLGALTSLTATAPNLLTNPGFEAGTLTGWTLSGAGKVIGGFGSATIQPAAGAFMFLGHTGNGSVILSPCLSATDACQRTTLSQTFNVASMLNISFKYVLLTTLVNCTGSSCSAPTGVDSKWQVRLIPSSGSPLNLLTLERTVQGELAAGTFSQFGQTFGLDTNGDGSNDFTLSTNNGRTTSSTGDFTTVSTTAVVSPGSTTLEFSVTDLGDADHASGGLLDAVIVTQDPPLYFLRDGTPFVRTDPAPLLELTNSPRTFDSLISNPIKNSTLGNGDQIEPRDHEWRDRPGCGQRLHEQAHHRRAVAPRPRRRSPASASYRALGTSLVHSVARIAGSPSFQGRRGSAGAGREISSDPSCSRYALFANRGARPGMPEDPRYVLTAHAERMMEERGIDSAWLERVLLHPQRTEADRHDPGLRHALGRIVERGGRVLRAIYNPTRDPWRVVTAYFDRKQRNSP